MFGGVLPEFQEFLLSRKLAPEKSVSYYARWVSKFLDFSNNNSNEKQDLAAKKFITYLKQSVFADWQVKQAEQALELYTKQFLPKNAGVGGSSFLSAEGSRLEIADIINKAKEAMRLKHYSYATERSYIGWVKRFYAYLKEAAKNGAGGNRLCSEEVRNFLSYLAVEKRVSSSTQNQAFNALLFLFREVLKIELKDLDNTVRAKRGQKVPTVLTVEEVKSLFGQAQGKARIIIQLLYGSGLRLMELARLRAQDIDFNSSTIFVRGAKQDKDRTTILPDKIKGDLRLHLDKVKELHIKDLEAGYGEVYLPGALSRKYPNAAKEWRWQYVFPSANLSVDPRGGKVRRHHISGKTIQQAVKKAADGAGIVKRVSVHTLRHSFATHLLMNGVNIREVQELLGHKSVETTMIYTHVLRDMSNAPKSPLDSLYSNKSIV
ncbi:MAG: integrase [Candidatus Omnitrophica bacterium CG11_big_fil_rev_8_21_14_0_20_42_13]|uniref:Integrase n=1 Tax=Candidatus Ghiorseimicrobium undicola TaxID=1974746 RepID=A0A2H0LVC5_9BACT|nr:MAG: integrase [Candidatus Omnitrophica bacterium CG11_big_fil_rev_8_21_14_0_20_42_13]